MKSCRYLEGGLSFAYNAVKVCAVRHHGRGAPELVKIDKTELNLESLLEARDSIRRQNQQEGQHPSCQGCPNLAEGEWPASSHPIHWLGITHYIACNLSCNYCWLTWAAWSPRNSVKPKPIQRYQIIPVVKEMAARDMFAPDTVIDWGGGGEPTLMPEFEWCFSFFRERGFTQWIHTNSVRMPKCISDLGTGLEKVRILTSIDAGSAETYRTMKNSAAFPSVLENLKGYKERGAEINIKYIVTEENCSETEARAFIDEVKPIAPAAILLDIDYRFPSPTSPIFEGLLRLQEMANEAGIHVETGSTGANSAPEYQLTERLGQKLKRWEHQQTEQHKFIAYERGDISGTSDEATTTVLTVHRAASTLLGLILDLIHEKSELPLHSQNGPYASLTHFTPRDSGDVLQNCYGIIGPLRFPVADKILRRSNTILHLRDPRDVLVSLYYSLAYSHENIPGEARGNAQKMGIDSFVLTRAPVYVKRFERYAAIVQAYPVRLLHYEGMMSNREEWLDQFLEPFGFEHGLREEIRASVIELLKTQLAIPAHENVQAHIRQARPRDHERKLRPETVVRLNDMFRAPCASLGISLD